MKAAAVKVLHYPHVIHGFKCIYFINERKKSIDVSLQNHYC
jgi:hypothetical protein